jgi:hypothetical protein
MTPKRVIVEAFLQLAQRLPVPEEELVEQAPPRRVGEGLEEQHLNTASTRVGATSQ